LYTAITEERYSEMRDILQEQGYMPDGVGGEDERTALHVGVQCQDLEALDILLQQVNVDCNVPDSDGLTPLMLAASQAKIEAFEKLLEDPRVNIKVRTKNCQNALDLLPAHTTQFRRLRAEKLFEAAKKRSSERTQKRKVAIIIANSNYEDSSGMSSLPGAKEDLEKLTAFLEKSYKNFTIFNDENIEAKVREVMEGLPDSCLPVTHFQLVYSGNSP
jgi:ankyrin repeat protein